MAWIGVDLDGTLARYTGWKGPAHIGEPVPAMLERVKAWRREGKDVRIFTARVGPQPNGEDLLARAAIDAWCEYHLGERLTITATKDFAMVELWDDRCVQVIPNAGARADGGPAAADRKLEVELLVEHVLLELAGQASLAWDPTPAGVFHAGQAADAARRAAKRIAELVAPRLSALVAEVEELARARAAAEREAAGILAGLREARAELVHARERLGHLGWVGGMILGIAEGAQGWALVQEYPAGHAKAEGTPAVRAVKELRRNLEASLEREKRLLADLARAKQDATDSACVDSSAQRVA